MNTAFNSRTLAVFTLTIFTSATLLFLVQPMIGKIILPKFGGTPAVWSTCMVFFQAALLLGYTYSHALSTWLNLRQQVIVHAFVLALPLAAFVIFPLHSYYQTIDPSGAGNPAFSVLILLAQVIGIPFLVVSTSAPLLQRWFSHTGHPSAKDPYFLYAASNLGSMLSLFLYPAAVEPALRLSWQGIIWMSGYAVLAALTLACALQALRSPVPALAGAGDLPEPAPEPAPSEQITADPLSSEQITEKPAVLDQITEKPLPAALTAPAADVLPAAPSLVQQLHWVALAFVPSSLMIGVTTYMTMDISAIPLLWLPPLALYLLTFILVFSKTTSIVHPGMVLTMPVLVLLSVFLSISDTRPWIVWQFLLHLATLFVVAMVCHGELAKRRPAPQYLTGFYLCMSLGGVLGGMFNALIAPSIFYTVAEYPLILTLACLFLPSMADDKSKANLGLEFGMIVLLGTLALYAAFQHWLDWQEGEVALLPGLMQPLPGLSVRQFRLVIQLGLAILGLVYALLGKPAQLPQRFLDMILPMVLALVAARFLEHQPFRGTLYDWVRRAYPEDPARLAQVLTATMLIIVAYGFSMRPVRFALGVGALLLVSAWINIPNDVIVQERSFFCVYRVQAVHYRSVGEHYNKLIHGTTMHGQQRLDSEPISLTAFFSPLASAHPLDAAANTVVSLQVTRDRRNEPLTYFHRTGPIGQIFQALVEGPNDRRPIAVLGLGTGTLAGYVLPGQNVTFFEIDPLAIRIAEDPRCFTYLTECRGNVNIILGDGRLKLKEVPDHQYRMLFMDAFSSDSIPIHLVTREAVQLYFEKLTDDGVLIVNVSNRYLRPAPVLANIAQELGLVGIKKWDYSDGIPGKAASDWVVLARKWQDIAQLRYGPVLAREEFKVNALLGLTQTGICLPLLSLKYSGWEPLEPDPTKPMWTDDFSNLLSILQ